MAEAIVTIAMRAQTAALKKGFREINTSLGRVQKSINRLRTAWTRSFTEIRSAVLLAQGALNTFLKATGELDEIAKTARRFGITAGELRVFRLEAEKTGATLSSVERIMTDFRRRLGEALTEDTSRAAKALETLQLNAKELSQLPLTEAMRRAASEINELGTQYQRATVQMDLFGRGAKDTELLLRDLDTALNSVSNRAGEFQFDSTNVEAMNDAIAELRAGWDSLRITVIGAIVDIARTIPVLNDRLEQMEVDRQNREAARANQRAEELEMERRRNQIAERGWSFASQRGWEISKFMENSAKWVQTIPFEFEKARETLDQSIVGALTSGLGIQGFNPGTARSGGFSAFRRGQDEMRRQTSILQAIENATAISADVLQNATGVAILGTIGGI